MSWKPGLYCLELFKTVHLCGRIWQACCCRLRACTMLEYLSISAVFGVDKGLWKHLTWPQVTSFCHMPILSQAVLQPQAGDNFCARHGRRSRSRAVPKYMCWVCRGILQQDLIAVLYCTNFVDSFPCSAPQQAAPQGLTSSFSSASSWLPGVANLGGPRPAQYCCAKSANN